MSLVFTPTLSEAVPGRLHQPPFRDASAVGERATLLGTAISATSSVQTGTGLIIVDGKVDMWTGGTWGGQLKGHSCSRNEATIEE